MTIQVLPDQVASQIAAGEVVERPASAVKELLENSLDAQASQIRIQIEQAGRQLIEVIDDGQGIPPEELRLAIARHATSKLRKAEDLFHIGTLGFRGEALASLASVARLTLESRRAENPAGARLVVEGGQTLSFDPVGAPTGTTVRVENLFFNVPARLKFLKQDITERRQIDGLVTRYALAYPSVRFHLLQDGRAVLQTSGNGNRREVLARLYGVEEARQMLEVNLDEEDLSVEGFISPVAVTRSHRRDITFFVNGRWVQDTALISALLKAYQTLIMVGRYPAGVLFLHLAPELVDVNVHPAKAEVRFREPDRVFSAVQRAVRRGLLAYSPVPSFAPSSWSSSSHQAAFPPASAIGPDWSFAGDLSRGQQEQSSFQEPAQLTDPQPQLPVGGLPLLRLVGQVGNTYIVAEGPDGIYLVDQHAAHERVLFERMMAQGSGKVVSQALLEPVVFQLPPESARLLTERISILHAYGFDVESFGPGAFRVRAIPDILRQSDPAAAVRVIVEDFEEDETPLQSEIEARLIARVCKRAAIKGGQSISAEEQRILLRDLEACTSPRTCPHGRPTMIHLSVDLLERQFGRKGSR